MNTKRNLSLKASLTLILALVMLFGVLPAGFLALADSESTYIEDIVLKDEDEKCECDVCGGENCDNCDVCGGDGCENYNQIPNEQRVGSLRVSKRGDLLNQDRFVIKVTGKFVEPEVAYYYAYFSNGVVSGDFNFNTWVTIPNVLVGETYNIITETAIIGDLANYNITAKGLTDYTDVNASGELTVTDSVNHLVVFNSVRRTSGGDDVTLTNVVTGTPWLAGETFSFEIHQGTTKFGETIVMNDPVNRTVSIPGLLAGMEYTITSTISDTDKYTLESVTGATRDGTTNSATFTVSPTTGNAIVFTNAAIPLTDLTIGEEDTEVYEPIANSTVREENIITSIDDADDALETTIEADDDEMIYDGTSHEPVNDIYYVTAPSGVTVTAETIGARMSDVDVDAAYPTGLNNEVIIEEDRTPSAPPPSLASPPTLTLPSSPESLTADDIIIDDAEVPLAPLGEGQSWTPWTLTLILSIAVAVPALLLGSFVLIKKRRKAEEDEHLRI